MPGQQARNLYPRLGHTGNHDKLETLNSLNLGPKPSTLNPKLRPPSGYTLNPELTP